jgi:hypothetical protein
VNNGGDYVASRRALLTRYAVKWLVELHDQDPALYGVLMYEICVETSQEHSVDVDILKLPSQEEQKVAISNMFENSFSYEIPASVCRVF